MKIYRTRNEILVENEKGFFKPKEQNWDVIIENPAAVLNAMEPTAKPAADQLIAPIGTQEVWAAGVTYYRSRTARMEEANQSGASDLYARVYDADRPELFFKSQPSRVIGPGKDIRIRKDSKWNVPEPELTLAINRAGKIVGYTIGNDVSSRDIEGENTLYLPQAKIYDGSCALGPCLYVTETPLPKETKILLRISRNGQLAWEGQTDLSQIKRTFESLVHFLYREMTFPTGCYLMTGTGVVPDSSFTLQSGDVVSIGIPAIGELVNRVA